MLELYLRRVRDIPFWVIPFNSDSDLGLNRFRIETVYDILYERDNVYYDIGRGYWYRYDLFRDFVFYPN